MRIHIVQKGETLSTLAKDYRVDLDVLITSNPQLASPDMMMTGMKIKIPGDTIKMKQNKMTTEISKPEKNKLSKTVVQKIISTKTKEQDNFNVNEEEQLNLNTRKKAKKKEDTEQEISTYGREYGNHFSPSERMVIDFQKEKIDVRQNEINDRFLYGKDSHHEQSIYCDQCNQPMKVDRPVYFLAQKYSSEGNGNTYPYIPTELSYATPNEYLS